MTRTPIDETNQANVVLLRTAAEQMRARARAATDGPWEADYNYPFSDEITGVFSPSAKRYPVKADDDFGGDKRTRVEDVEYIASFHPLVGEQVAIILDLHADILFMGQVFDSPTMRAVIHLAKDYLGEDR